MGFKSFLKSGFRNGVKLFLGVLGISFVITIFITLGIEGSTSVLLFLFFFSPIAGAFGAIFWLNSHVTQNMISFITQGECEKAGKILWKFSFGFMALLNATFALSLGFGVIPVSSFIIIVSVQAVYYLILFVVVEGITEYLRPEWPHGVEGSPYIIKRLRKFPP